MTSYSLKLKDIDKKWHLIDAKGLVLGRLASRVALILRGKNKAIFTPHLDCGDNVVIINAEKVALTGKKLSDKKYYRHTGYPGGIRENTPADFLAKKPEEIIKKAVFGMLGKGPMGRKQLKNLYIYAGEAHPHEGQKPVNLDLKSLNKKNSA